MTEPLEFMDYNRYPPITIYISQQDNSMNILVDPPNLLTVKVFELLHIIDLSQFQGLPNTKDVMYGVKAVIARSIQQWRYTREHNADMWPEVNVVVGKKESYADANWIYFGDNFIAKG